MVGTVVVVVWTHDLAQGVLVGVLLSGIFFASKVRRLFAVRPTLSEDGHARTYVFTGQIFFASVERSLAARSEEHTYELQSLMRNSYAVFSLKKKTYRN